MTASLSTLILLLIADILATETRPQACSGMEPCHVRAT